MKNFSVLLSLGILVAVYFMIPAPIPDAQQTETGVEQQQSEHASAPGEHAVENGEAHEGEHAHHGVAGAKLPLWSGIPFVGILLSIALCPLFMPHFWHHHFPKVSAMWALLLAVPYLLTFGGDAVYDILHIYMLDYVPFIILLWALYTVSGGILLKGTLVGTPIINTTMLLIGTLLASWMGTTGAAMLMIRPFLRANKHRQNKTFMVCFFIFLVANIGGSLTPLGDPPLFLGFLRGVPFFWTFKIMPHMLTCAVILLSLYYVLDLFYYKKEGIKVDTSGEKEPLRLEGTINFLFLIGIVAAVLMSGLVKLGDVNLLGIDRSKQDWLRDFLLIGLGSLSLLYTSKSIRESNEFTWFPIKEVAYLFAGIFMTMIPCLKILQAGEEGAASFLVKSVTEPYHYFWITGLLSSFLDNAPTYLTFLSSALGRFYPGMPEAQAVHALMENQTIYLEAISAGAVFFGANTYIGNAPNFMVRSIAEESGVPMPSFFGYFLMYGLGILFPLFALITFIFFLNH